MEKNLFKNKKRVMDCDELLEAQIEIWRDAPEANLQHFLPHALSSFPRGSVCASSKNIFLYICYKLLHNIN